MRLLEQYVSVVTAGPASTVRFSPVRSRSVRFGPVRSRRTGEVEGERESVGEEAAVAPDPVLREGARKAEGVGEQAEGILGTHPDVDPDFLPSQRLGSPS